MASSVFGIDLGTTYSCIAYIDETGNAVVAKNLEGSNITPSVVFFEEGANNVVVGEVAKDGAVFEPDRTASFVKRLMGRTDVALSVDGQDKSPEEISSYILRKLALDATQTTGLEVKDVVITVPAYFGDAERNATKIAGDIAGLNVLQIVQEPVAASVYYGASRSPEDTTALVYDLGGGTFDVNVISVKRAQDVNNISVEWTDGDSTLGGRDWDASIIEFLKDSFREQTGYDDDFDDEAEEQFQALAEKAKKALSSRESQKVTVNIGGQAARVLLTRDRFDELTTHLLRRTLELTRSCVDKAQSEKGVQIDRILLVGGSTRMPQVEAALREAYPDIPIEIADPDEAVAKGAALCALDAALAAVANEDNDPSDIGDSQIAIDESSIVRNLRLMAARNVIQYATSKSYGVETLVQGKDFAICNLIKKNQPIPTDTRCAVVTERFGTHVANQTAVEIKVYENDSTDDFVDVMGDPIKTQVFDLGSMGLPAGAPVDVTFSLSEEGLLTVAAIDVTSGKNIDFEIQVSNGLSAEKADLVKSAALNVEVE